MMFTKETVPFLPALAKEWNKEMRVANLGWYRTVVSTAAFFFGLLLISPHMASAFQPERANFTVSFSGLTSNLRILSTTVMPDGVLTVNTESEATASNGKLTQGRPSWVWKAPSQTGLSVLTFTNGTDRIILNVFVLTPWKNGTQAELNGYKIGRYDTSPFRGLAAYEAPTGFIEVTPELLDTRVSPHFTLRQFLCKQQPGHYPAYVLIRPGMLMKIERLLEAANAKGWPAETFNVMSGFRTPYYNKLIGNTTTSSRHLYGGAADVFIDNDGDDYMDDLNGDGKVNIADARVLADLAKQLSNTHAKDWRPGGIAAYAENSVHGPFVHVDVRGYQARWGK
ncbi:MAG: hypothetical protein RIB43_02325 [Rhodospirillaceae bacterium]